MKKLLLLLSLTILLFSCTGNYEEPCETLNCGLIIDDDVSDYSVLIRNDCTGNEESFILTPEDWLIAFVGGDYCITNSDGW